MAAGYKDFTAGAVLSAADLEDYCQNQSILRFASAAARDAALSVVKTEGMYAYLIDLNVETVYSGAAWSTVGPVHGVWTAYTPTWSGTIGNGTIAGAYMRIGRTVSYRASVVWGSTTSHAAANQSLTLPVAPAAGHTTNSPMGQANSYDVSAVVFWTGSAFAQLASTTIFLVGGTHATLSSQATQGYITNLVPMTWATTDTLSVNGTYEAGADA